MNTSRNICIATCDIVGPIRNGGIGSAYTNLAQLLARAGHKVTVLYALGTYCETRNIPHWQREYRRQGIELVPLPAEHTAGVKGHPALRMSVGVYEWLKTRQFDVVHCHEWRGVGYFTAQAKRQGLCLPNTVLCVGTHSPTLWHLAGMNELATPEDLEVDFMERGSVAMADVLWSPSRYMVQWLRREGWRLPSQVLVLPNVALDLEAAVAHPGSVPRELVFFGRLETRKGLDLFCDALDQLTRQGLTPERVTFLGKSSTIGAESSDEYLARRSKAWPFAWRVDKSLDRHQAMAYLRRAGRLAVLPSRVDNQPYTVIECLGSNIPFIACSTGGIPELVKRADRERTLCAPSAPALSALIARALTAGHAPVTAALASARTDRSWLKWHADAKFRRIIRPPQEAQPPLVSVCLTHYNRPDYLRAAVESIEAQDYPFVEIVLVDDGSTTAEAKAELDRLQPEFDRRGWTIVRQSNRYLGAARNAAVAASSGRYVLFMDDDNLAVPNEISTFVRAAETSGAWILTCFLQVFQDASPTPRGPSSHVWPFLGPAVAPGLLRNAFGDANAFVHRDVFRKIGGFTEDVGVGCEDWEFFARAVLSGIKLEVVPEALVRYRQAATGMLGTTSAHANRMRALRPYLSLLPAQMRSLVHLSGRPSVTTATVAAAPPARLDHVERAVVFGSGEAGRLAIDLAGRCGWSVPWIVDNNQAMWNTDIHERPVKSPESLTQGGFDLVIVASMAGKTAISAQLSRLGLTEGRQFVHFLDPVQVGSFSTQVQL
ncbi:MAG TPA: glycosyltransferase [Vicinamibacterales bacterium]|nr:glycosyltransferase [Vicinamibacterales bacterium]